MNETENILIAEFMELQTAFRDVQIWMDYENKSIPKWDKRDYWLVRELKYATSWDWIIPVWFKIMEYGISNHGNYWDQQITSKSVVIKNYLDLNIQTALNNGELEIKHVYNACIEFIKWYNQNKKV